METTLEKPLPFEKGKRRFGALKAKLASLSETLDERKERVAKLKAKADSLPKSPKTRRRSREAPARAQRKEGTCAQLGRPGTDLGLSAQSATQGRFR